MARAARIMAEPAVPCVPTRQAFRDVEPAQQGLLLDELGAESGSQLGRAPPVCLRDPIWLSKQVLDQIEVVALQAHEVLDRRE